jgi:apolipoprotein N-acyltransferase
MVNIFIFEIFHSKNKKEKKHISFLVIFTLIACLGYGIFKLTEKSYSQNLKVSLIQGNIPQEIKWDEKSWEGILNKYIALTKQANQDKPDVIIWPETAFPGYFGFRQQLDEKIILLPKELKVSLLFGAITVEDYSIYNSAILISSEGKVLEIYHKLHLVPFGEYVPFRGLFSFLPQLAVLGDFTPGGKYTIFSLGKNASQKFSALICFEDTIPELSRQFVKNGANLLVNITNDAWFKDTSAPFQHLQTSVFRAIENRTALVRSANTGVSAFIDREGRIIDRLCGRGNKETFVAAYKTGEVELRNGTSFYSRYGDVFVFVCFIIFGLSLFRYEKRRG